MAEKYKKAELSERKRNLFDGLQSKIKRPDCFGAYHGEGSGDCSMCVYHPDCKVNTKNFEKIAKKISEDKNIVKDLAAREKVVKKTEGKLAEREKAVSEKEAELDKREEELTAAEKTDSPPKEDA